MIESKTAPVVIVGAGPTGITAATLLAQYGVESLVLDRWADVYPQPRAVHLDDEVYRIVHRLGIADEFAKISRPALGLRLLDPTMTVLAEFQRDPTRTRHGHPEANMFDQPEFEALLRTNLERHPQATLRGNAEVTDLTDIGGRPHPHRLHRPRRRKHPHRRGRLRPGLRRRQQPGALAHRIDHAGLELRAAVAGRRRRDHGRPRPVGRRPPTLRSASSRHLHADRRGALPLGVSAPARRDRRRLPHDQRPASPHRAVDRAGTTTINSR